MRDIGLIHRTEYELDADRPESLALAEAPGRIHYLGEHGEPKARLFLSSAVDRHIKVAVSLRKDNSLRFFAADLGERKRTTLVNLKYKREDRWANYIKTAIHLFAELGYPVKGLNFTIIGDIPQQVGLASSSAIEVAAAIALRRFFHASLDDQELAQKLLASHIAFFGKKNNIVDYLVILLAQKDHFLLIDEASLEIRAIPSPLSAYRILLMDSRVPRSGVEEELRFRRQNIKKSLAELGKKRPGISFRNIAAEDLLESMGDLSEENRRRCMHIVQELRRAEDAEELLKKADLGALSRLFFHSHESLRDLYEVSCPEIDWLVKRAQEIDGVLGSRMTGQGFGGCTYTIISPAAMGEYRKRLEDYERIFGFHPQTYEISLAEGARVLSPPEIGKSDSEDLHAPFEEIASPAESEV